MLEIKNGECFLGRTLTLSDGKKELSVTLDVGPRIIDFRVKDGFNIMYEDVSDAVNKDVSSYYGEGAHWHIYGGHRLWLSPEDITTYYPDNGEVVFELVPNGVEFKPKAWEKVEVQPSVKVEFLPDGDIRITHSVTNLGKERKLCLWALTVMKSGGEMTVPLSNEDTGFLANRNIVMWPYASFADVRFALSDGKAVLKSSEKIAPPFKFGIYKRETEATYELERNGEKVRFTKRIQGEDGAEYPDYCCNFESYCTDLIHEIETLSPVRTVPTGETAVHTEIWRLERK